MYNLKSVFLCDTLIIKCDSTVVINSITVTMTVLTVNRLINYNVL